jgi:hypothetical protein
MGKTAEAAKKDKLNQMEFYKKTAFEESFPYPDFLDKEFEVVYNSNTEN